MANSIWPHLPSTGQAPIKQVEAQPSLAEALYPRPKPKPPNPYRESLLRGLKELNAKVDARLQRERGR